MAETPFQEQLAISRTQLANERTFAAWIRTGLSVAAAGFAVDRTAPADLRASWQILSLSGTFIATGAALIVFGGLRFNKVAGDLEGAGTPDVDLARRAVYAMMIVLAALVATTLTILQ